MTKYTILISLLVLFLTQACKDKIEPSNDGKVTAVVYGILDQSDSLHFFKINRAFYGGGDAASIAKIADSSYFKTVNATVKEYDGSSLKRTWILKDTLIINKEPGAFYSPEQVVYYFETDKNSPLIADDFTEYRLEIVCDKGLSTECTITGKTKLINNFSIVSPKSQIDNGSFKFATMKDYIGTNITMKTGNAAAIECKLYVEFDEYEGLNLKRTVGFNWDLGTHTIDNSSNNPTFEADGETFYKLIKSNCSNDNTITKRMLKAITINAYAADDVLNKYLILNKPNSSLAQAKPSYTNLIINNDYRIIGFFSARNKKSNYYYKWIYKGGSAYSRCIDQTSTKELCQGAITGMYLFCSDLSAYDQNESFYCD